MAGPNEIKTTISLEGTKQVEADLRGIGTTAEQTGRQVSNAFGKVDTSAFSASMERLKSQMASAGKAMQQFAKQANAGIKDIRDGFSSLQSAVGTAAKSMAVLGTAAAGVGGALLALASNTADAVEKIDNLSYAFGVSSQDAQRLQDALAAVGGDAGLLEKLLTSFEQKVGGGLPELIKFAQSLDGMTNAQDRLNAVIDVFGKKNAATYLAFLRQLSVEFDGNKQAVLGILPPLSDLRKNLALAFDFSGDLMFENLRRLKLMIGADVSPAFTALYDIIRKVIGAVGEPLSEAIGSLSQAIADVLNQNAGSITEWANRISADVIGVINDITNLIRGNDAAVQNKWLIDLVDLAKNIGDVLYNIFVVVLPGAFATLQATLGPVADFLNSMFGTDVTANYLLAAAAVLKFSGAFEALSGAFMLAKGSASILLALCSPGGALLLAIAAIGTAAFVVYENWDGVSKRLSDMWEIMKQDVQNVFSDIAGWLGDLFGGIIDNITANITGFVNTIENTISNLWNDIKNLWSSTPSSPGGSGYATGGWVRGPGSGTSDSIPAWLSNGEFVINAKAAAALGHRFLSAINGIRNSSALKNGFPRFATGGWVGMPSLAMAGPGGRPVNLTIGGERFSMSAADDVAERLVKFAGRSRVRSAGRKPAWYGA